MKAGISGFGSLKARRALARAAVLAGVLLAGAPLVGVAVAAANDAITVMLDQAKLVKLPDGTNTIVVGNPAIADVSVQTNGVMVITGRKAGRTNFIALDKSGSIISESMVTVSIATAGRVLVQRGQERASYDCAPECLPVAGIGDDAKSFSAIMGQAGARTKEARDAMLPPAK